jgi:hypothetical protein
MKFLRSALAKIVLAGTLFAGATSTFAGELAAYKDRLFSYPGTLSTSLGGALRIVDYREMRDINKRDEIPEKRVRSQYVSLYTRRFETKGELDSAGGLVTYRAAGNLSGASFITIYLHGQGGNSRQGMNDFTFGGNFNRIKNLMVRNDGLYVSPDFADFGENGETMISALAGNFLKRSPSAKLFVACGSMGGYLCWRLAADQKVAPKLSGLLLLGSMWDYDFLNSAAFKMKVPIFFGQGSHDTVFPVEKQEAFFRSILKADPDYPVRFVRFETGTHGTPIRMIDWRETLNWMLAFH